MKKLLFLTPIILLFLVSCSKNKVFEKFEKFENNEWPMDKVVLFDVAIEDTSAFYDISIPVRHIDNFPYDGLLVVMTINTPSGEERSKKYKLKLRDDEGKFIGDVSGDIWDTTIPIIKKTKFNNIGTYKFEIVNDMPQTPTPCVMEIGLRIDKSE
jgi:gliding motility-associated lipoprotein GldH